jgi:RHS repeat-associated protein
VDYTWNTYPPGSWQESGQVRYVYDGMRVMQERNSSTPTVAYTRGNDLSGSLEGAGGIGGLLARSHGYSGGTFSTHSFYHADGNGNVTYLVNSSQAMVANYRYDPYGNTLYSGGTLASANVYRFSSKEQMANSGLYYYGYRFYDPNLQRWPNRDPVKELGHFILRSRQSVQVGAKEQNLYTFVRNAPGDRVDVLGLDDRGWPLNGVVCNDCFAPGEYGTEVYVLINGQYFTLPAGQCTANDPVSGSVTDVDGVWICPATGGCSFYAVKPNTAPFFACSKPLSNCPKWDGNRTSPNRPFVRSGGQQNNLPPSPRPPVYRPPSSTDPGSGR